MKIRNKILATLSAILIMSSTIFYTYAVTKQDEQDVINQINDVEKEIQSVEANLSEAMKEIKELEGDISEVEYNLEILQADLKKLNNEISQLEKDLEQAVEDYNERYEIACTRVVSQYKYANITFLDVLLNSTSLTNFLTNYHTVEQIMEGDQELLEDIEKERQQIEADKATLEEKKKQLEEDKQKIEKQKVELSNKKANKQKLVSGLNNEEKELQKQKEEYNRDLENIQAELKRLAAQSSNNSGAPSYSGGTLQFPCPGFTRVSSRFGSRGSPLAGGSSYHKGVDLAAPKGANILAAESGTVITVYNGCTHNYGKSKSCRCGGGFGNYVMVNHGNGLVTVYAHCTSIDVKVGQSVTRGQVIATVGTTGASTGNHLHFGTLLNGTYVNPEPYIGI